MLLLASVDSRKRGERREVLKDWNTDHALLWASKHEIRSPTQLYITIAV